LPPAKTKLNERVLQFRTDLVAESVKVSGRRQADAVSAVDVERARENLASRTSHKIYRHLGALGGVLLGAALSKILDMGLAGQYSGEGTVLSASLGIIGAFMIALHFARD